MARIDLSADISAAHLGKCPSDFSLGAEIACATGEEVR